MELERRRCRLHADPGPPASAASCRPPPRQNRPLNRIPHVSRLAALALLVVPVFAACTTQTVERPSSGGASPLAGVAPVLSVERFLQAVNAEDYDAMARLFGTVQGPIRGEATEVELRMATIAQILRHQDYQIQSERLQPGRTAVTRRVGVDLTIDGRLIPDVAFLVVQTANGRWMVQEIDLEKVTGG